MKEEIEYYREIRLLQELTVTLELAGLSPDGSRFRLRNEFFHSDDGKRCARITTSGGWLDLSRRKLVQPPKVVVEALESLTRTDDFEKLRSSINIGA